MASWLRLRDLYLLLPRWAFDHAGLHGRCWAKLLGEDKSIRRMALLQ